MTLELTNERVFSFDGPNLCLLGNPQDFRLLAEAILQLTGSVEGSKTVELTELPFIKVTGDKRSVLFSCKKDSRCLGSVNQAGDAIFELDGRVWERLFILFTLMSWNKCTYYLNAYESYLSDLNLAQECNFICSSEFDHLS